MAPSSGRNNGSAPASGVGAVRSFDRAGRQAPTASSAGGPSARLAPSPTAERGTGSDTVNLVDLTGSARAPRVRFPEIGSGARGPAARRGDALTGSRNPSPSAAYDATRTRTVADRLENARVRQVDDDAIRNRYRGPANDRGVSEGLARGSRKGLIEPSTPADRARRAPASVRLRQVYGDDESGLEARRATVLRRAQAGAAETRSRSPSAGRGRTDPALTGDDGRRGRRLSPAFPAANPAVEEARRGASVATEVAVATGLGVTVGVFGGSPGTFYDPYYGSKCDWYAGWYWGFNFCWWNSSYWSSYCFGYSPWWNSCYGSSYYSWCSPRFYYPVYYSYPVYSEPVYYETPATETVYVEEQQPIAQGEAAVQAIPSPDPDLQASLSRAASYYLNLGDHAFRDGRFADAVHFYAKAVEYAPDQGVLYLILSDALFATGDYHYAAFALRKAVELDPALFDAPVDKRTFYTDPEDFERQLATLELYLEDHFIDDDARLVLAANYLFGDRPAAAVDLLQESFSEGLRGSPAGTRLLEAARALQYGR